MHPLRLRRVLMPGAQPQEVAAATDDEVDPLLRREGTSRNGWQPTADALLAMYFSRQPVATDGNGFALFSALPGPSDLPLIATSCNHGAP
jgi:hypothetical protein